MLLSAGFATILSLITYSFVIEFFRIKFYTDKELRRDISEEDITDGELLAILHNQAQLSKLQFGLQVGAVGIILIGLVKYYLF